MIQAMQHVQISRANSAIVPAGTAGIREAHMMMTMPAIAADELGKHLAEDFRRLFGSSHEDKAERLDGAARIALECLGKSDALYHNVEHTFLVTLVGRDILHGRMLTERLEPDDYSHLIVACLLHDIGYVRGILKGDGKGRFVVDASGRTVDPGARGIGCGARALSRRPLQALHHGAARAFATHRCRARGPGDRVHPLSDGPALREPAGGPGGDGWSKPRT